MLNKLFSVYDSGAEAYLTPWFCPSKGEAIRAITNVLADPKHNFSLYPGDFTLFEIGEWDNIDCSFKLHKAPLRLGVLVEFKRSP